MSSTERPGGEGKDWVDPERRQPANAFDSDEGVAGLRYSRERERLEGGRHPSGEVDQDIPAIVSNAAPGEDIPPQNGRRASFDAKTGVVRGSGAGAGGGNPGEDYDSDSASGHGYPQTGSEGRAGDTPEPGPAHVKQ